MYDNEINSGNKLKDYRTDILFIENPKNPRLGNTFNIEMYKNFKNSDLTKSYNYAFKLLSTTLKEGEKYYEKQLVQVNFCDGSFKNDKKLGTICYMMSNKDGRYKKDFFKIYEIYLQKYKGLCYNESEEIDAMLSFLSADSYDEMERIAGNNEEALYIMEKLKELSEDEEFYGAYDHEQVHKWQMWYEREEGRSEGKAEEKLSNAIELIRNEVDLQLISKSLGYTIEELEQIKKDNNL